MYIPTGETNLFLASLITLSAIYLPIPAVAPKFEYANGYILVLETPKDKNIQYKHVL